MSTATDVVRARDELFEMYAADRRSRDPRITGIKRMNAAIYMAGPGDAGHATTYDGDHDQSTLATCMTVALLAGLTSTRPENTAANYYVAAELHDSIVGIADALPDDTTHDDAPPPSPCGFALLGAPWRFWDLWGREHTVEAVSWAPGVVPVGEGDDRKTLHPMFVGLWTRLRSSNYDHITTIVDRYTDEPNHEARYSAFGRHGWLLTRVSTRFWAREDEFPGARLTVGPPRIELTAEEQAQAAGFGDLVSTSNYNAGRLVHALLLVLAGVHHVPGSTRDPVPAVEVPNRTRTKVARRSGASPLVSMIYAGAERPATPRENVGTRGPIGVRYWRQSFTRRRRRADGSVRIETVRGGWCGDPTNPVSERTKVRIARATLARPADVAQGGQASTTG